MKFSKRIKYMLLGSIIFLVIALRYPTTPHEIGWDSFFIHKLINTLNHQGYPSWWIHPFSTFGLTPFSYASAGPVVLSGFSQVSGLSIENSILLFGIICGLLGIFGSYLVAKQIFNNDLYIFLVVFGFSTCEIFLTYTSWTMTTRGLFIAILPFFIFLILRKRELDKNIIFTILIIITFIFLVATFPVLSNGFLMHFF